MTRLHDIVRWDERTWTTPADVRKSWHLSDGRSIHVRSDGLWMRERDYWWRRETFLTFWPPRWRKPRYYPWKPKP
jgi:hypothetical protein